MDNVIRLATAQDAQRVWQIRNHPEVLKCSLVQEVIPLKSHLAWFEKKYLSHQKNYCYLLEGETHHQVIGYCRFDIENDQGDYRISIAIDPAFHGRGLGHYLLNSSLKLFRRRRNNPILAEIQKNNILSLKLFDKNKFEIYSQDEQHYYLKYV